MRSNFALLALLLAATMAAAQMRPPQGQSPNPYGQVQPQTVPPNQAPSNAPSPSSGNQQAPSSTASGHKLLQAKSQDELKAYQGAMSKTDPAQMNAAADAFAAKYPSSELKAALFVRSMNLYGQANNAEKLIELGRKAITADPTNPVSLVQVGAALVEGTRDTDMDRDQRLTEAAKDAQGAIDNVSNLMVPPDAPADKVAAVKANILSMAYGALGMVDLNKGDAAGAEQEFLKAVDASKAQPEAVIFLRLSVAQDKLKKYPEALDSANKAVQYAPEGSAVQNLAKQQQARLQKLMAAASGTGIPSSIAPAAPAPNPPAAQTPAQTSPTQTPPAQTPPAQTPPAQAPPAPPH
jgi:tetratricopeptide (TPR) repeat protein